MTITELLKKLTDKMSATILTEFGVVLGIEFTNIATLKEEDDFIQEKSSVVLSIVNIEEDRTLKNQSLYKEYTANNSFTIEKYKKPAQNLNLSLLFSSYTKDQSKYSEGIDKLEFILRYLQNNNVFYYDATTLFEQNEISAVTAKTLDKIIIDLLSLKTEQVNQMWSYLGSRYMPSVLYSMRLIHIQKESNLPSDTIIDKAKVQFWSADKTNASGELESGTFKLDIDNTIIPTN